MQFQYDDNDFPGDAHEQGDFLNAQFWLDDEIYFVESEFRFTSKPPVCATNNFGLNEKRNDQNGHLISSTFSENKICPCCKRSLLDLPNKIGE